MKRLAFLFALLATVVSSPAIVISNYYNTGFANGGVILDNDPNGWINTQTVSGYSGLQVTDVAVVLNISSGWNGDLYGYLTHSSGTVVLLNRVGQTEGNPGGFKSQGYDNVMLSDILGTGTIQNVGSYSSTAAVTGGPYNSAAGTLDTAFDLTSVNGNWTLFLADLSTGDVSTLNSWSLVVTAVPEPTTWAAIIFGGVFGVVQVVRRRQRKA
jgi:subtilisin-like proprotein convertase family protein